MSDEQREDQEPDVEAHRRHTAQIEHEAEGEDKDDDVEAHVRRANSRMDSTRHI